MQLWSGIPASTLFESYVVESLNANQVAFELLVENLDRALKSAQFSTECICKLTKKNGNTYLTFIVEIQGAQVMTVVQDVPIKLLSPTVREGNIWLNGFVNLFLFVLQANCSFGRAESSRSFCSHFASSSESSKTFGGKT